MKKGFPMLLRAIIGNMAISSVETRCIVSIKFNTASCVAALTGELEN